MHRDKADAPGTVPYVSLCKSKFLYAVVMELADMQDLGSCAAMRVGSTPINRTNLQSLVRCGLLCLWREGSTPFNRTRLKIKNFLSTPFLRGYILEYI